MPCLLSGALTIWCTLKSSSQRGVLGIVEFVMKKTKAKKLSWPLFYCLFRYPHAFEAISTLLTPCVPYRGTSRTLNLAKLIKWMEASDIGGE